MCYTKAYSKYTLQSLQINIPRGLDNVTVDNIHNYFRKAREYMFAYLEGVAVGSNLENHVKMYKKSVTSHRRVSALQQLITYLPLPLYLAIFVTFTDSVHVKFFCHAYTICRHNFGLCTLKLKKYIKYKEKGSKTP